MDKVKWKGGALIAPLPPVMVSVGSIEKPNIITIAWTGIINTIPPKTYISVRPERYSYDLIKTNKEFVINLSPANLVMAVDFCGVRSGRDIDKFKAMNLTASPATEISTPIILECPINLECRVCDMVELGSHHMFIADIVAVTVDEDMLDKDSRLQIEKCNLLAFAHGEYFKLGEKVGSFGFSVRKNKKASSRIVKPSKFVKK
jgi:flavin reductase (DIM6/NTAB) family NADH-FMN oxidoreductase RutF